jgi:hypothetical protein
MPGKENTCRQNVHKKPEGKKSRGKCMRKWEDNIKIDLKEIG